MIKKIYHLADLHCRLYKRHAEYQAVFNNLFKYIDATKEEDDVIILAGDIVHSKTDMSPELIQIVSKFFKDCADRLPTILILGNHDCNLQNPARLDSLTPIVDSLNHPNLHYWRETGVYQLNGVDFSVMSVLGKPTEWILADKIANPYKIAIHHGALNTARTDLGYTISNELITPEKFEDFWITILGDIHQQQFLNERKTIAYSSSLLQQNYGESLRNHGLIVWDVKSRKGEFVEIENDYGYFTFEFRDGKWINPENKLPKIIRSRVKYENTDKENLIEFFKELGRKHQISEIIYQKKDLNTYKNYDTNVLVKDMRDVENQNQLICDFLRETLDIKDEELLDGIRHLNREINSEFASVQTGLRAITWRLKRFIFSNMFSYGEGNVINFEDFNGTVGIFAPNASGKTASLAALCFCLFDKCPVGSKGIHILNTQKDSFFCKVSFEIAGKEYFITRKGVKNEKTGNVKVDVDFWVTDEDGNNEKLNGEDRDSTNKIIRDYIGTYEDFMMTTLSSQVDNQSFIEKSQRERKELLYKFLDISVFETLWKLAKDRLREVQFHLKELNEETLQKNISESEQKMTQYKELLLELQDKIEFRKSEISKLTQRVTELSTEINNSVVDYNLDDINEQIRDKNHELNSISTQFEHSEVRLKEIEDELNSVTFTEVEFSRLQRKLQKWEKWNNEQQKIRLVCASLQSEIRKCEEKITHLKNHEYNPECEYCIRNQFVIDAKKAENDVLLHRQEYFIVQDRLAYIQSEIKKLNGIKKEFDEYQARRQSKINLEYQAELISQKRATLLYKAQTLKNELKVLESEKLKYYEQEIIIKKNADLNFQIRSLKSEIVDNQEAETISQKQYRNVFAVLATEKEKLSGYLSGLEKISKYTKTQYAYDVYIKAVSKEGVPYKILSVILPLIEHEVNDVLAQLVDFSIKFEASDDKNIFAYIVYSEDKFWPVEMTSGMERFILSQAIRTALTNISNLPKSNFIAIDEGFGVLDSDNLNSIHLLFEHLKQRVDFVLCISHIDSMRDIVDSVIQVDKIDGFSKIDNEGWN